MGSESTNMRRIPLVCTNSDTQTIGISTLTEGKNQLSPQNGYDDDEDCAYRLCNVENVNDRGKSSITLDTAGGVGNLDQVVNLSSPTGTMVHHEPLTALMQFTNSASFDDWTLHFPPLLMSTSTVREGVPPPIDISLLNTPRQPDSQFHVHVNGNYNGTQDTTGASSPGDLGFAAAALLNFTPYTEDDCGEGIHIPGIPTAHINARHHGGLDHALNQIQLVHSTFASRSQRLLGTDIPYTKLACKCKSTRCLKLYCHCFQTGTVCDEFICKCQNCCNTIEASGARGERTRAIYEILNRRIDAFEPRLKKRKGHGCSCRKNRCLQKYCDCFAMGKVCSQNCVCINCSNAICSEP